MNKLVIQEGKGKQLIYLSVLFTRCLKRHKKRDTHWLLSSDSLVSK